MTEAEVFASCLALSHCHFLDTPYEGDPFSDELNSGASNVCHYCTIDTLLSIIEKQCLRFTDVRFLNDSTDRKSTRLNSSHPSSSRMPSSA